MRFLSLFSGIEAASVAWLPLGWECVAVAEIEKFPSAVLAHHYPSVPNLGDITKITREQIAALGHIDLVVGGFPCQDLSVAGKRKGLKNADGTNTRSGLFFTACQISEWAGARWTLVENVPGLFSSHEGRDFASVVGELSGAEFDVPPDGWENAGFAVGSRGLVEWATLDAQFFGVAQRRRRVFIIRDSGTGWASRPPVLLERESLRGDSAPRRETGQGAAPTIAARTRGGGGLGTDFDCDGGLIPQTTPTLRAGSGDSKDEMIIPIHDCATRFAGSDGRDGPREGKEVGKGHGLGVGGPADPMFTLTKGDKHAVGQAFAFYGNQAGDTALGMSIPGVPPVRRTQPLCVAIPVGIEGGPVGYALSATASHSGDKGDGGVNTTMVAEVAPCLTGNYGKQPDSSDTSAGPCLVATWPAEVAPTLGADYGAKQGLNNQNALNGGGLFVLGKEPQCPRLPSGFGNGDAASDAARRFL